MLASASVAMARPSAAPQQCLNLTVASHVSTSSVLQGLGLTPDQIREMRSRLSQYTTFGQFSDFGGIGLTQQQIATIKARLAAHDAAQSKHPLGWPCKRFANRTRTLKFVRQMLVGNGFRAYSIKFYGTSPNQIQFSGIQDGVQYAGAVARSGVREITVQLTAPRPDPGGTYVFATPFDA